MVPQVVYYVYEGKSPECVDLTLPLPLTLTGSALAGCLIKMSSLASRRLNCPSQEQSQPDLSKLEISKVSDIEHGSRREDMTSSEDDDYCDNINQFDQLNEPIIRHGAETAPVVSETESSLKRYSILSTD